MFTHMKRPPFVPTPHQDQQRNLRPVSPRSKSAGRALGQHFLIDGDILQNIISAAKLDPQDTVVEVGPGLGALTQPLVNRAKMVVAIEMDSRLAASLPRRLGNPPNLRVINADAREVGLAQVLGQEREYKLVANLPYYAANPILRRFLEAEGQTPSLMVVTLQREVAESMVAEDGRMSLLAVGIQFYGIPRIVCSVPPAAFNPRPEVTSAVVRIDVLPRPAVEVESVGEFFDVVRAGFSAPRKQLRNSLALGLGVSGDQAGRLLDLAGLNPKRRPENLNLIEWRDLYRVRRNMFESPPPPENYESAATER